LTIFKRECGKVDVIEPEKKEKFDPSAKRYYFPFAKDEGFVDPESANFTDNQFSFPYLLRQANLKRETAQRTLVPKTTPTVTTGERVFFLENAVYSSSADAPPVGGWRSLNIFMVTKTYGFSLALFYMFIAAVVDGSCSSMGGFVNTQNRRYKCNNWLPFPLTVRLFLMFVFGVISKLKVDFAEHGCQGGCAE
jgi:hypothetical protein